MDNFSERYSIIYRRYEEMCAKIGAKATESGMARLLEASQPATQRWKAGKLPNPLQIKAIHDKLGFAYDWLIAGEGEMFDEASDNGNKAKKASLGKAVGQE